MIPSLMMMMMMMMMIDALMINALTMNTLMMMSRSLHVDEREGSKRVEIRVC